VKHIDGYPERIIVLLIPEKGKENWEMAYLNLDIDNSFMVTNIRC